MVEMKTLIKRQETTGGSRWRLMTSLHHERPTPPTPSLRAEPCEERDGPARGEGAKGVRGHPGRLRSEAPLASARGFLTTQN